MTNPESPTIITASPGTSPRPRLSLAILCYRAQESIVPFVERMHAILSDYSFSWEIILVANYDQPESDLTPSIATRLSERLPNTRALTVQKGGMMGWDMIMGLKECRGEFLGVVDGDGQFPHEAISACIGRLLHDNVDIVKTYRVLRGDGLLRNVVSWIYNALFRALFPRSRYFDINSKPKFFRRDAYERLQLESTDWFIDAEIMIRAGRLGMSVAEIPIHFNELEGRYSFVRIAAVAEFFKNLWRYRFGDRKST